MEEQVKKTYNKSHSGKQCLGPCYKSNTPYLHPITLHYIVHANKNTCPTYKWWNENTKQFQLYDECNLDKNSTNNYDVLNILSPTLNFDEDQFIKLHYNIYTFNAGVDWLIDNISNYYSSIRISECLWRIYGDTSMLTDKFIKYYIDFMKLYWMKNIYTALSKYVVISNDTIQFTNEINNNKIDSKYKTEIINFFVKKFINPSDVYDVLRKYIKNNNKYWKDIEYYNKKILDNFINYCINNIKNLYDV